MNASSAVRIGARIPSAFWAMRVALGDRAADRRPEAARVLGRLARRRRALRRLAHAATSRLRPPPVIRMPSCSSVAVGAELADDLSLVDDEDAVGEREDLLQLERDEQDAATLVALLDEAPVHELDRADVEAAGRLRGDQHARVAVDLAREDDLLLVATGEPAGTRLRPAAADVELLHEPRRALDEAAREEPAEPRVRRAAVVVQRDVLGDRELEHEAAPLPVLRNVAEARVVVAERVDVREVVAFEAHGARRDRPQAAERVDQLGLAVAVDAGDADDLAGPHLERDVAHLLDPAVVERVQALDLEERLAGRRRLLVDAQQHLAPDHQPRQALLGRAGGVERLDLLAAAQHGDPVGDLEHLVELVGDEDDRLALGGEAADDREELLRLLRRQHGRRLVEDEDVGAAIERLQDLDALLLADRDVLDEGVRVDDRGRTAPRSRARSPPPRARRAAPSGASARRRGRCSRPPSSRGSA